jgi:hypothetical protein
MLNVTYKVLFKCILSRIKPWVENILSNRFQTKQYTKEPDLYCETNFSENVGVRQGSLCAVHQFPKGIRLYT